MSAVMRLFRSYRFDINYYESTDGNTMLPIRYTWGAENMQIRGLFYSCDFSIKDNYAMKPNV